MAYIIKVKLQQSTLVFTSDSYSDALQLAKEVAKGNHMQCALSTTYAIIRYHYNVVYRGIIRGNNTRLYNVTNKMDFDF